MKTERASACAMPMAAEMAARWWLRVVGVEAAVGRAGGAVGRSGWRRGVDGAARARLAVEDAEGEVKGGGDGAGRLGGEERRVDVLQPWTKQRY
jgi:hypothetical protein